MSGNLPYPCYSRLKTFFNTTTYTRRYVIYYYAWHSTSLDLQFNSLITKETKWKLNHFSHFCLQLCLKTVFDLLKLWLRFRSTSCAVRCGDQQLRCTHCTYGLFQFGSAASPWNTSYSCWRWRYLLLEAVGQASKQMESQCLRPASGDTCSGFALFAESIENYY